MSRKTLSYSLSLLMLAALVYTIYSNLFLEKSRLANEEAGMQEVELLEKNIPPVQEEGNIEYRQIEEPEEYSAHFEEGHEHVESETEVHQLHSQAPDFELKTLTGETVRLSELKGRKVFVNFWTTWCPPCVEEMPVIQRYYEKHAKEDSVILSVNATDLELAKKDVAKFSESHGITFPILLDENGEVSINYEILTIPTSIIIDEEGIIIEKIIGPVTEEMLAEKLFR